MTQTKVATLLPYKALDNVNEKDVYIENVINLEKQWQWDKYHEYNLNHEYENYLLFQDEEEKSQSVEQSNINIKDDSDERSSISIITLENIKFEVSNESRENSFYFCFREIDISDSQLNIPNAFNLHPVTSDLSTDMVKKIDLRPITCLKDISDAKEINLRYYGLNTRILRAICEALIDNETIESLDMTDNWLSFDACYQLNEFLLNNTSLISLNLSGCKIGARGAKKIEEGISYAPNLQTLILSGCELNDEGIHYIANGVHLTEVLQNLDLSDNHLSEGSAKDLETIIIKSETLKQLNLSWNSLHYSETSKIIFRSIPESKDLKEIDLSWNALGSECTPYLCSFLSQPSSLKVLKLGENRFSEVDAEKIAKILPKNTVLEEFHIGNNPLKPTGALQLIQALTLEKAPQSKIRFLNLENIWVKKDVLPALETIGNLKPWLNIKLGGVLSNFKLIGPDKRKLFLNRANFEAMNTKKKKERKNFGHFVLSLEDGVITIEKFEELVEIFKLKLSKTLANAIAKAFEIRKNLVDLNELKAYYSKEYPDTQLPPKKEKKSKNEKTDKKQKKHMKNEKPDKKVKIDEISKTKKKKVTIKNKNTKLKSTVKEVSRFEIQPQEYEFGDIEYEDLEYANKLDETNLSSGYFDTPYEFQDADFI